MDEKKFKLGDLPDEKSGRPSPTPPNPRPIKTAADPRLETLKPLINEARVDQMKRKWAFDKSDRLWGWAIYIGLLLLLEKAGIHENYVKEIDKLNADSMDMGGTMLTSFFMGADYLVQHPLFLAILTPLFFKFSKPSDFLFEVTFDGIKTVKKINLGENELPHRVFLKWNDIAGVSVGKVKERPILILNSIKGPVGELVWDIKDENKKALKLLMKGLLPPTHALSQFLEKEVT